MLFMDQMMLVWFVKKKRYFVTISSDFRRWLENMAMLVNKTKGGLDNRYVISCDSKHRAIS